MVRYVFNNVAVVAACFAANRRKSISCRTQATKDMFLRTVRLVVDLPCKDVRGMTGFQGGHFVGPHPTWGPNDPGCSWVRSEPRW